VRTERGAPLSVDEVLELDGIGQAKLLRRGEVTPLELVEAACTRINGRNPTVNAVVTEMADRASEWAAMPLGAGPLAGVPMLLKDLTASCEGVRRTEGSVFLRDHVDQHDSELVRRLKAAGLLIVGKTSTSEFGNVSSTEPALFGPCQNPWQLGRTAGGSSGGSAAAVAAGMVAIGHATDSGGSIRTPAACCGLFGLKPTRGRNPFGPDSGSNVLGGLMAEHVVTRSVRDSAAVLDATSGPDVGDPYRCSRPDRPFLVETNRRPRRLRIAYTVNWDGWGSLHPECERSIRDVAKLCSDLGHDVVEAHPDLELEPLFTEYFELWGDGAGWLVDDWASRVGRSPEVGELECLTDALANRARGRTSADHLRTIEHMVRATRVLGQFLRDHDVWLTSTLREPPLPLGGLTGPPDDPLSGAYADMRFTLFEPIANMTGHPAMSVPLSQSVDGLPIGSHFTGRFADEATLFGLAAELEDARPWSARRPPEVYRSTDREVVIRQSVHIATKSAPGGA
jgi:amidase